MMQLPALSAEERACLQSGLAGNVLTALAERLRRHLMVSLGGAVAVGEWPGAFAQDLAGGDESAGRGNWPRGCRPISPRPLLPRNWPN